MVKFSYTWRRDKSFCFRDLFFWIFSFCIWAWSSFSSSFFNSYLCFSFYSYLSCYSFFSRSFYSLTMSSRASWRFFYFSASINFYSYCKNSTTLSIGLSLLLLPIEVFSAIFTTSSIVKFSKASAEIWIWSIVAGLSSLPLLLLLWIARSFLRLRFNALSWIYWSTFCCYN